MAVVINEAECIACGNCIDECPQEVLELADDTAKVTHPDDCIECGICVDECPVEAITL